MKKITKILFVVAIMFIASLTFSVSAQEITIESEEIWGETVVPTVVENQNVSFSPPFESDIVPFGTSVPSNTWSWSNGGYEFSGNTYATDLYTNYLFTGTSMLRFYITRADDSFTIEVYCKDCGFLWTDTMVRSFEVERITAENLGSLTRLYTISGLNASSKYYAKVLPPAVFSGTIGNN